MRTVAVALARIESVLETKQSPAPTTAGAGMQPSWHSEAGCRLTPEGIVPGVATAPRREGQSERHCRVGDDPAVSLGVSPCERSGSGPGGPVDGSLGPAADVIGSLRPAADVIGSKSDGWHDGTLAPRSEHSSRNPGLEVPTLSLTNEHPEILLYTLRIRKSPFFYASRRHGAAMYAVYKPHVPPEILPRPGR